MLAWSELGDSIIKESDNGFDVLVGSLPGAVHTFKSYADHPRQKITLRPGLVSSAAGRYQILARTFDAYKRLLELPDFSPASQDAIALQLIKERKAMDDIQRGDIVAAINKCGNIWASLPNNNYQQHQNKIQALLFAYQRAGGQVKKS